MQRITIKTHKKRVGKSRAITDERTGRHCVSDEMMDDFLREQGILPPIAKVEAKGS